MGRCEHEKISPHFVAIVHLIVVGLEYLRSIIYLLFNLLGEIFRKMIDDNIMLMNIIISIPTVCSNENIYGQRIFLELYEKCTVTARAGGLRRPA